MEKRSNVRMKKRDLDLRKARLSLKFSNLDTDQVNSSNFIPIMRFKLLTEPDKRTPNDIEMLKKCTSFLSFFKNIMRTDPEDKRKAHENGCRFLRYRVQRKGSIVTKYKDNADEFYITLKGNIGILIPRNPEAIQDEVNSVFWIRKKIGYGIDITRPMLDELVKKIGKNHTQVRNIRKYREILEKENKVLYRDDYIREAFGGLGMEEIPERVDLYSETEMVNVIKSGNMFGELGIIYKRQRAATCIALEEIELGYMGNKDFDLAFESIQKYEERCKVNFIEDFIITDKNLKHLSPKFGIMFKRKNILRGNVVFKQGEIPDIVLFITKGQVALRYSWTLRDSRVDIPLKFKQKIKKTETFVLLCRGEMIGEEALFKQKKLCYEVISDTECDFYYIEIDKLKSLCKDNAFIKEIMIDKIENKIRMIGRRMKPYFGYMKNGNEGIPPDMMRAAEEFEDQKEFYLEKLPQINHLYEVTDRKGMYKQPPQNIQSLLDEHNTHSPNSIYANHGFLTITDMKKKKKKNYRNFEDGVLVKKSNIYRPISKRKPKRKLLDDSSGYHFGVKYDKKRPMTPKTLNSLKKRKLEDFDIADYTRQHQNLMKRLIIPLKKSLKQKRKKKRFNFYQKSQKRSPLKYSSYGKGNFETTQYSSQSPRKKRREIQPVKKMAAKKKAVEFNPALSYVVFSNSPANKKKIRNSSVADSQTSSNGRSHSLNLKRKCRATSRFQKLREFNRNLMKSSSFKGKLEDQKIEIGFDNFLEKLSKSRGGGKMIRVKHKRSRTVGNTVLKVNTDGEAKKKKSSNRGFNISFKKFC